MSYFSISLLTDEYPLDTLVENGWIVLGSMFYAPYSGKEPSQAQRNVLFDLDVKYLSDHYSLESWKV